jgi:hypothetical protein
MGDVGNAPEKGDFDIALGLPTSGTGDVITARKAGTITDLEMSISPQTQTEALALRNLAKALNLALKSDFLETDLDQVYKAAQVRKGAVRVLHKDYIGLGDGLFASIGKTAKSFKLTLQGPDPASPEGEKWVTQHGFSSLTGVLDLIGRKLNLIQEYEDKVPIYVEQTLDRLESRRMIRDWHRNEWKIETTAIGLDIIITPIRDDTLETQTK